MKFAKYLITVSLLVFFLFFILQFTMYENVKKQTIQNIFSEQLIYARQAASGIQNYVNNDKNILVFLSGFPDIINLNNKGRKILEDYLHLYKDEIKGVTRVNRRGKIMFTYPNSSAIGMDISHQDHFILCRKIKKPVISDVFIAVQGFRTIAIHVPVFKKGKFDGTIAFLLSFDKIANKFIKNIHIRKSGYAWVVSKNGIEISSPFPGNVGKNVYDIYKNSPEASSLLGEVLKGKEGFRTFHHNVGNKEGVKDILELVTYCPVSFGNTFWSIVITTPEEEVINALEGIRFKLQLVTIVILLMFAISIYFIFRFKFITEEQKKRTAMAEALNKSEAKYTDLFEKMLDGVYKSTHEGKFLQINNAMVRMLGYNNKQELFDIDIKSDLYFQESDRESAALEEKYEEMAIFRLRKKDGSEIWVEDHGRHVLDDKGNVIYHEGVMRDVSERLKTEAELIKAKEKAEEASRLKSNFLAHMSHELRTPLVGILGYAEFLESRLSDEELKQMIRTIRVSGKRLNATLNSILDISKVESENTNINMVRIDIITRLREQTVLFKATAESKGLQLFYRPAVDNLEILTDEELFDSIISNLLNNAIKFTGTGTVTVTAGLVDGYAKIEIADTGIGVSEDQQDLIFETFRQASEGLSRKFEGSGLGLTLVKKYLDLLGGSITIKSKINEGSTFIILLPFKK